MNIEDQLQRQININMQLRRQLETARRDAVEYCAKFCEDHEMGLANGKYICEPVQKDRAYTHPGDGYAEALRGIIGK
jgi:hypothetical protein